jgi:pyridoxal phosphate enzyme (YggS family)
VTKGGSTKTSGDTSSEAKPGAAGKAQQAREAASRRRVPAKATAKDPAKDAIIETVQIEIPSPPAASRESDSAYASDAMKSPGNHASDDDSGAAPGQQSLQERLDDVRNRIASACARAGRDVSEVTLIAVTKSAAPEQIREAISLGLGDLGENRVQQLQQRAAQINEYHARVLQRGMPVAQQTLPPRIRWHMIGHLQRNKVKQLLPLVSCIHSIDSLRLAEEIDAQAARLDRRIPVMLQVNASEEPQKYGVAVGAAVHLGEQIASMPNLQLVGLMSMAAYGATEAQARFTFCRTREIFEEMRWHKIGGDKLRHLSMGMSGDFESAILEGATMIRVGTQLFGAGTSDETGEDDEDAPG